MTALLNKTFYNKFFQQEQNFFYTTIHLMIDYFEFDKNLVCLTIKNMLAPVSRVRINTHNNSIKKMELYVLAEGSCLYFFSIPFIHWTNVCPRFTYSRVGNQSTGDKLMLTAVHV